MKPLRRFCGLLGHYWNSEKNSKWFEILGLHSCVACISLSLLLHVSVWSLCFFLHWKSWSSEWWRRSQILYKLCLSICGARTPWDTKAAFSVYFNSSFLLRIAICWYYFEPTENSSVRMADNKSDWVSIRLWGRGMYFNCFKGTGHKKCWKPLQFMIGNQSYLMYDQPKDVPFLHRESNKLRRSCYAWLLWEACDTAFKLFNWPSRS